MRLKGFKTVMEIDTMGTFNLSSAAFPALRDSGRGVIINISATLHYGATWYQAHASAAKAAIDSLTRSLGLEWGAFNIRVCGIAPGPIAGTPGMTKLAPGDDAKVVEDAVKEVIPLGRMGTTADIAYMATFLCSDAGALFGSQKRVNAITSNHARHVCSVLRDRGDCCRGWWSLVVEGAYAAT